MWCRLLLLIRRWVGEQDERDRRDAEHADRDESSALPGRHHSMLPGVE